MTQPPLNPRFDPEPVPGYDALTTEQAVARLSTLSAGGRDAVEAYERSHLARREVLRRAAELSGRHFVERASKEV